MAPLDAAVCDDVAPACEDKTELENRKTHSATAQRYSDSAKRQKDGTFPDVNQLLSVLYPPSGTSGSV